MRKPSFISALPGRRIRHVVRRVHRPGACLRRRLLSSRSAMTVDSLGAPADSSLFFGVAEAVESPVTDPGRSPLTHHFLVEWLTLIASLVVVGMLIATALFRTHQSVDTAERTKITTPRAKTKKKHSAHRKVPKPLG